MSDAELPKLLFDYEEAATIFRVSPDYLIKHKRTLYRTEIGRSVSFCLDDIEDNIREHRVMPEAPAAAAPAVEAPPALMDLRPRGAQRKTG